MDPRVALPCIALALACATAVVVRASSAPAPDPGRAATLDDRTTFAASVAAQEQEWREQAARTFPADLWSQRDAFHGLEAATIRDLAHTSHVPYEEVLRAIDEDVHLMRGRERAAAVVPCKPRPFYD